MPKTSYNLQKLNDLALRMRRDILRATFVAGAGHTGGSLSMVELVIAVFTHGQKWYKKELPPLVISKGHAAAGLYAWLVEQKKFPRKELDRYRGMNTPFQSHVKPPTKTTPGINGFYPSGSLTHGLSLAGGVAIAERLNHPKTLRPVYCIMGDTEMQGGQVWEAARQIAVHQIGNVVAICDDNGMGNDYRTSETMDVGNLVDRWASCGWKARIVTNGHDLAELLAAFDTINPAASQPTILIAKTIKGKGVSFMENENIWHGQGPNEAQLQQAYSELQASPPELLTALAARAKRAKTERALFPKDRTLRDGPAAALLDRMAKDKRIVVIAPELAESTRAAKLKKAFPDRVFNVGVQEPHAMDLVAGLAFSGKIPVMLTFTNFLLLRTVDQVFQNIAPFGLQALLIGTHDGFMQDGMSVTPANHFAIARSFYGSRVLTAADFYEAKALTTAALDSPGYSFLFVSREEMPYLFSATTTFTIEAWKIYRPKYGQWIDRTQTRNWQRHVSTTLTLLVAGSPFTWCAMQAAQQLYDEEGIDSCVVDVSSIKPLDEKVLRWAIKTSRHIAIIEKHQPQGGLFSAVAEWTANQALQPRSLRHWPTQEWLGQSGTPEDQLQHYGFDTKSIKRFIQRQLKVKF